MRLSTCIENTTVADNVTVQGFHFASPLNFIKVFFKNEGDAPYTGHLIMTSLANCSSGSQGKAITVKPHSSELYDTIKPIDLKLGYSYRYNCFVRV